MLASDSLLHLHAFNLLCAFLCYAVNCSFNLSCEQVIWAGFDRLQLGRSAFRHVLLLGYKNGFQVLDVEDASNFSELVSRRDSPVSFLQIQPIPVKCHDNEEFRSSHPLLLVVAGDESLSPAQSQAPLGQLGCEGHLEFQSGNSVNSPTSVRFYSLRAHSFVHVLRFRSAVLMVRCSPRIVAVGLATQVGVSIFVTFS